jgi:hypothetical protein
MTCNTLQDAIVDVARGRDAGAGTIAAVDAHVEQCGACRTRFARERRLSEGLRALAVSSASRGASASVEGELLRAFGEHHAARRPVTSRLAGASWLRAAAAVLVVAGAIAWWWVARGPRVPEAQQATSAPSASTPQPETPAIASSRPVPAAQDAPAPSRVTRNASAKRPATPRIIRPEGFVALPSAAGLPAFESGEIVRLEVPVTSLPMYGIDISPEAKGSAVEADFLVGQDGQARAIRLVRNGRH